MKKDQSSIILNDCLLMVRGKLEITNADVHLGNKTNLFSRTPIGWPFSTYSKWPFLIKLEALWVAFYWIFIVRDNGYKTTGRFIKEKTKKGYIIYSERET